MKSVLEMLNPPIASIVYTIEFHVAGAHQTKLGSRGTPVRDDLQAGSMFSWPIHRVCKQCYRYSWDGKDVSSRMYGVAVVQVNNITTHHAALECP